MTVFTVPGGYAPPKRENFSIPATGGLATIGVAANGDDCRRDTSYAMSKENVEIVDHWRHAQLLAATLSEQQS